MCLGTSTCKSVKVKGAFGAPEKNSNPRFRIMLLSQRNMLQRVLLHRPPCPISQTPGSPDSSEGFLIKSTTKIKMHASLNLSDSTFVISCPDMANYLFSIIYHTRGKKPPCITAGATMTALPYYKPC